LPHAQVRVAPDGELEISGTLMAGYLGEGTHPPKWWPTGDLGRIDADGFVYVEGRKKNVLITGFGRNVSPEWVESALRGDPAVAQAVVFGEGQPALSAVLWPLQPGIPDETLQRAVAATNAGLPDYARVARWARGRAPFDAQSGLATANGRPRRDAILALHAQDLGIPSTQTFPPQETHALLS
jgi:long-subunit acyl-CoA synthetase (AMP-forming)